MRQKTIPNFPVLNLSLNQYPTQKPEPEPEPQPVYEPQPKADPTSKLIMKLWSAYYAYDMYI